MIQHYWIDTLQIFTANLQSLAVLHFHCNLAEIITANGCTNDTKKHWGVQFEIKYSFGLYYVQPNCSWKRNTAKSCTEYSQNICSVHAEGRNESSIIPRMRMFGSRIPPFASKPFWALVLTGGRLDIVVSGEWEFIMKNFIFYLFLLFGLIEAYNIPPITYNSIGNNIYFIKVYHRSLNKIENTYN